MVAIPKKALTHIQKMAPPDLRRSAPWHAPGQVTGTYLGRYGSGQRLERGHLALLAALRRMTFKVYQIQGGSPLRELPYLNKLQTNCKEDSRTAQDV